MSSAKELKVKLSANVNGLKDMQKESLALSKRVNELNKAIASGEGDTQALKNELAQTKQKMSDLKVATAETKSNIKDYSESIKDAEAKTKSLSDKVKSMGESFKDMGAKMSIAGGAITASMIGIVAKGAEWSAQVEGQKFLYENLDKAIQESIDKNSKNAKAIGLTTQQYKDSATTIATYYKNMGMSTEETARLGDETMNLVADLGAVVDMPFDEAMSRFKSGLMGNFEALDAFGVNLSANTLSNSEYVKSLGKAWNQLSDNEKMMATYNEILRQSAPMTGLAKQEAESFGMQFKLLKEQISETVGKIGSALLPVLEPLVAKISEIVDKISSWVEANPKLTQAILIVVGVIGLLLAVFGPILMLVGACMTAFASFAFVTGGVGVGIMALISPILLLVGKFILIIGAIGLVVKAFGWLIENFDVVIEVVKNFGSFIMDKFAELTSWCSEKASEMGKWVSNKFSEMSKWCSEKASTMKNNVVNKFNDMKEGASQKFNTLKENISKTWDNVLNFFKNINLFDIGKNIMQGLINGIKSMGSYVVDSVKGAVSGAVKGAKNFLGIHSPSRVFMQIGEYTGEGLALGIDAKGREVEKASTRLGKNAINGFNPNMNFANNQASTKSSGISLNIANFNNNRQSDIEALASELSFYSNRKSKALGGV